MVQLGSSMPLIRTHSESGMWPVECTTRYTPLRVTKEPGISFGLAVGASQEEAPLQDDAAVMHVDYFGKRQLMPRYFSVCFCVYCQSSHRWRNMTFAAG